MRHNICVSFNLQKETNIMQPAFVELVENKEQRIEQLKELYVGLSHYKTDTARFAEIIRLTKRSISLRTLNAYAKEYNWKGLLLKDSAPVKPIAKREYTKKEKKAGKSRKTQPSAIKRVFENIKPLELEMPANNHQFGKKYTLAEKERIVKIIAEYFSLGIYGLITLCEAQKITYQMYMDWISEPDADYLYQIHCRAKQRNESNYLVHIEENLKMQLLYFVNQEDIVEIHTIYEMDFQATPEGEIEIVPIPKEQRKIIRKNKMNPAMLSYVFKLIEQMKTRNDTNLFSSMDIYDKMTSEELKAAIKEVEEEIEQMKREQKRDYQ